MELNGLNSQPSNPVYSGAKKAEAIKQVSPKAQNGSTNLGVPQDKQVKDTHNAEKRRLDTVVQAASAFKNVYAVSDTTFTIFKDSTGQFVTRFKSLKDGAITYVPEPDIGRFVETNNSRTGNSLKIDA